MQMQNGELADVTSHLSAETLQRSVLLTALLALRAPMLRKQSSGFGVDFALRVHSFDVRCPLRSELEPRCHLPIVP